MGMSASQARLLSITSRLTNNEFRAQTITNSKLRLATESEEASQKYMDALEQKQLMFMCYDGKGDAIKTPLTAAVLYNYADIKNQYSLINPAGKILVSSQDAKNFEETDNLADFLARYGLIEETEESSESESDIPKIIDKSKAQWYTNLWNRMNGSESSERIKQIEDETSGNIEFIIENIDEALKNLSKMSYEIFDDNLYTSPEWLQFALEHGIVTLEQASYTDPTEAENNSLTSSGYTWISKPYTNASDIISQDNETAIAIAEAKYKKEIKEIENQDKKYDQDLKKLDTEHNALQTEYEAIKEAINKNVERSFKAFS